MPIKGLTTNVRAAFPSLGTLRKGAAKPERGPGVDLDFFRFTSDRPEVARAFVEAYGEQPALLHVYIPHATVDEAFACWQEEWVAGGLMHRCDGEEMVRWRTEDGDYSDERRACPYHTGERKRTQQNPGCKAVGRLALILPELVRAGYVGYVTLLTTSINDIVSITGSLRDAAQLRAGNQHGLRGIEWVLRRQAVKISTPGSNGRRVRREKSLVRLEPAAVWVQYQIESTRAEAMGQLPAVASRPAVTEVDASTGEILDDGNGQFAEEEPVEAEFEDEAPAPSQAPRTPEEHRARVAQAAAAFESEHVWTEDPAQVIRSRVIDLMAVRQDRTTKDGALWSTTPATQEQRGLLAAMLNQALGGRPTAAERHAVHHYLVGKEESAKFTMVEVGALLEWLCERNGDGKAHLRETASAEARTVYQAAQVAAGQQRLV